MSSMTLEELEEFLSEALPTEFKIKNTVKGIVIYTGLVENQYGELVPLDEEDLDYDSEDEEDEDEDMNYDGEDASSLDGLDDE